MQNLKQLMRIYWTKLSYLGISAGDYSTQAKRIRVSNQIAWGFFLIAWPFVVFFALLGLTEQSLGVVLLIGFWALTPILNHLGYFRLSRLNLMFALNVAIAVYSYWLGVETGIPLTSFAAIVLPFILYEFHDDLNKVIGLSITVGNASFLLSPWNQLSQEWGVDLKVQHTIANFMTPYVFVVLLVIIYVWYRQNALTERELEHHIDELEEASKHKDEFLANMSHEIRTPMNGIIGMNQLMAETPLDEEQSELQKDISVSSEMMLSLVNDILDFSKIESGKLEIESAEFSLHSLIEEVVIVVKNKFSQSSVELLIDIDSKLPDTLVGDSLRVKQVLLNLLGNASKFTLEGFVKLSVSEYSRIENEIKLEFKITDTGIGIAQSKLEAIFESFSQADGSTSRKFGGTGLGLSISKNLVELMGGQIFVSSELGQGTEFGLSLNFGMSQVNPVVSEFNYSQVLIIEPLAQVRPQLKSLFLGSQVLAELPLYNENTADFEGYGSVEFIYMPYGEFIRLNHVGIVLEIHQRYPQIKWVLVVGISQRIKQLPKIDAQVGEIFIFKKPWTNDQILNRMTQYKSAHENHLEQSDKSQNTPSPSITTVPVETDSSQEVKILLVEDNLMNQKLMVRIFKKLNLSLEIANNGQEAIEKVDDELYDLILMDLQMPIMGGIEAATHIRELERIKERKQSYITALTANSDEDNQQKCQAVGMNSFLTKPVQVSAIKQLLSERELVSIEA